MRAGHSLLSRIRNPAKYAVARRKVSDSETRESVLEHLQVMCQTRQGTMLSCPEFGTASVSELVHNFPDAIALMAKSLKNTIQEYEPRLAQVRIKHVPSDDMTLRYEVTGQLICDGSTIPVQFETSIDTTRKLSIR